MQAFTQAVGERIQVIGDDYLVTSVPLIEAAVRDKACNAVLLKPNQVGTLSETYQAMLSARAAGMGMVVSARSGETEDTAIVHLATGWNTGQLKVGSFARSERMAKWNEGLRIENSALFKGGFAGTRGLPLVMGVGVSFLSAKTRTTSVQVNKGFNARWYFLHCCPQVPHCQTKANLMIFAILRAIPVSGCLPPRCLKACSVSMAQI